MRPTRRSNRKSDRRPARKSKHERSHTTSATFRNNGIRWNRSWIKISSTLREEYVGCEEVDDGVWNVWFGPLLLGRFDERELKIYGVHGLQ